MFSKKYKTYRSWQRNYLKTHTKDTPYYKRISRGHIRNPFLTLKELRGHKEKPKPDIIYLLTWISYKSNNRYSWQMDQMKVTRHPAFEKNNKVLEEEQEAYCLKYLSKAFTKALGKGKPAVFSTNWVRDLGKYKEYPYTDEILENMGLEYTSDWQNDGVPEESLELWRLV